jgi:hypothetical protein
LRTTRFGNGAEKGHGDLAGRDGGTTKPTKKTKPWTTSSRMRTNAVTSRF